MGSTKIKYVRFGTSNGGRHQTFQPTQIAKLPRIVAGCLLVGGDNNCNA